MGCLRACVSRSISTYGAAGRAPEKSNGRSLLVGTGKLCCYNLTKRAAPRVAGEGGFPASSEM